MFEVWICVVGDGDDERLIYKGNDFEEVDAIIHDHADEVDRNPNKYFLVNDQCFDYTDDFDEYKYCITAW